MTATNSRGIQAVLGGVASVGGWILAIAPHVIPILTPSSAKIAGVVVGVLGVTISTLSHPPRPTQ